MQIVFPERLFLKDPGQYMMNKIQRYEHKLFRKFINLDTKSRVCCCFEYFKYLKN